MIKYYIVFLNNHKKQVTKNDLLNWLPTRIYKDLMLGINYETLINREFYFSIPIIFDRYFIKKVVVEKI